MKLTDQHMPEELLDEQIKETSEWICFKGRRILAGWLELKQRRAEERAKEARHANG